MKMLFLLLLSLLIFVGCPYIDHGTTYATDRIVKSVDAIEGCYYREYVDYAGFYKCEDICIDSVEVKVRLRRYHKNEMNAITELYKDTMFVTNVEINNLGNDGTINKSLLIEGVGAFNYYENVDSRELVDENYKHENKEIYSTRGKVQCDY